MPYKDPEARKAYHKAYRKAYYAANKEKIAAQKKAYQEANKESLAAKKKAYCKANKEKISAKNHAYYEDNKEEIAAQHKAYREDNKEKIAAQKKAYQEDNKEKMNAKTAKRRARKLDQTPDLNIAEKVEIESMYLYNRIFNAVMPKKEWHVDHIVALANGGLHHPSNLQVLTKHDNLSKGARE